MATQIANTTVSVRYQTQNGVRIVVQSWAENVRNNRGRIVALDYDSIITNISLDTIVKDKDACRNPVLIKCITELEDEIESVRNDAISHFRSDLKDVCDGLGADHVDFVNLIDTVFATRNKVLSFKPKDA